MSGSFFYNSIIHVLCALISWCLLSLTLLGSSLHFLLEALKKFNFIFTHLSQEFYVIPAH
jgi:hypothetical protein